MISTIISRLVILVFGTLYPVYASYKAVRSKNVKEYVKWMMYWIVFGLFTFTETITDIFLSWFPFYYEIKILLVLWLLTPATKGSSILYRKFVHPMLSSREQEIDECISKVKQQTYRQVMDLGSKGVTALMQTALKFIQEFPSQSLTLLSDASDTTTTNNTIDEESKHKTKQAKVKEILLNDANSEIEDEYLMNFTDSDCDMLLPSTNINKRSKKREPVKRSTRKASSKK